MRKLFPSVSVFAVLGGMAPVLARGATDAPEALPAAASWPAAPDPAVSSQMPEVPVSLSAPRRRLELLAGLGLSAGGSSWSGDPLGYGSVLLGLRLFQTVSLVGGARIGYGRVDQRLLTLLSVGLMVGGRLRERYWPYGYVGFAHQHEESLASVAEQPLGALLGIGTGIRHRAGGQALLGVDIAIVRRPRGELLIGPEIMLAYLGYSTGPRVYGTVGIKLGGSVKLW